MLTIRLARVGKKKHATYRVVVQEKHKATSSNALEILGHYNPHTHPASLEVKADRVQYWISKGAQLSDTLHNLFLDKKLVTGEKRKIVRPKKREEEPASPAPATASEPATSASAPQATA